MTEAEKEFIKYTDPYQKYGEKILLKIDHTMRVENLCIDIAKSLGLKNDELELSAICGLLHDIGRFEQWRRYQTYNDLKSVDHGDLGAELLRKNDLLNTFIKTNHNTVLKAVKYHNKYRVPNTLSDRNKLLADITRDADKIDVLYLFAGGKLENRTHNSAISDSVYQTLLDKKAVRKTDVKTKADRIAVCLAFAFDLNSKRAFEIVQKNNYINKLIDIQLKETSNDELKEQLEELRMHINGYLEKGPANMQASDVV